MQLTLIAVVSLFVGGKTALDGIGSSIAQISP
jgi:hypothetical protein